jgi:hypothetical protein
MSPAERYRRNANECVAVTSFLIDPRQRAAILALAEAWSRLAEQAEKNAQIRAPDAAPLLGDSDALSDRDRSDTDWMRNFRRAD